VKLWPMILACLAFCTSALAQTKAEPLQLKTRIGFEDGETIINTRIFDDKSKLLLIGRKNLQLWDLKSLELLHSITHEMKRRDGDLTLFSPDNKRLIVYRNRFVPLNIKRDATPEPAAVYDLSTGKQIAALQRPASPIRRVEWSSNGETIVTLSNTLQKEVEISFWDGANFTWRSSFTVRGFCWHYLTRDGATLFVGSGPVNFLEKIYGTNSGNVIRAYNTLTGKLEDELAPNDNSNLTVGEGLTVVSGDEKFLATKGNTKGNQNILIWDLAKRSSSHFPVGEIARTNPKKSVSVKAFSGDSLFLLATQDGAEVSYDTATWRPVDRTPADGTVGLAADKLFLTRDRKYAVSQACSGAKVFEVATKKAVYSLPFNCQSAEYDDGSSYSWTNDAVLPNDDGTLLLEFQEDDKRKQRTLTLRRLASGEILQTLTFAKKPATKDNQPKWSAGNWWFKDNYLFALSQDERSVLIWSVTN
jgi:WD40 repeat protein